MTKREEPDLLKAAMAVTHGLGSAAGLVVDATSLAYLQRTPEHIAEVARLAREHEAMNVGIDRYQDSRANGYEDKVNEVFVDTQDALEIKFAISQDPAKQT